MARLSPRRPGPRRRPAGLLSGLASEPPHWRPRRPVPLARLLAGTGSRDVRPRRGRPAATTVTGQREYSVQEALTEPCTARFRRGPGVGPTTSTSPLPEATWV